VIDILGEQFQGILTTDCYLAYDDRKFKEWLKQKCVGHLLEYLVQLQHMVEHQHPCSLPLRFQSTCLQLLSLNAKQVP
jgi:hypothetical protein